MYNTIYLSASGKMLTLGCDKVGPRVVNRDTVYFRVAVYNVSKKRIARALTINYVDGNAVVTQ